MEELLSCAILMVRPDMRMKVGRKLHFYPNIFVGFGSAEHGKIDGGFICRATHII